MTLLQCPRHPKETTLVRCGRCERPICTRCMVDSPVGKKCRECASTRTHLDEASHRQILVGALATFAVAIPTGIVMQSFPLLVLPAVLYGWLVSEVAIRSSGRKRSLPIQIAAGAAALTGSGIGLIAANRPLVDTMAVEGPLPRSLLFGMISIGIAVVVAVLKVRSF